VTSYTDPTLTAGAAIKAVHVQELRDRVKEAFAPPSSSCSPSQNLATSQFVKNFYQGALARQPNAVELQSWTDQLRQAYYQGQSQEVATAIYMGRQLFKSQEYANRNRDNHWFVYDLYWAYLQRDPDSGGWSSWESLVNSIGRDAVRAGFEQSTEFATKVSTLCPGSTGSSAPIPTDGLASLAFDSATNRITTAGFQYDAAGNQTRIVRADGSAQKFQYDAANRLVKVRDDYNYTIQAFTYGDDNQRLITQDGDDTSNYRTYYATDGDAVIAEYSETPASPTAPQWSKSYIYLGARLLSTLEPNGSGGEAVRYHHPDRLGTRVITTAAETNPMGTTAVEQVALPFGTALDNESTGATNRRFTSYDRSAMTGLDYAVNRHYDSQQGRFTQVDPIGMQAASLTDPQSLNMYRYVGNDPVNRMDPTGLFWGKLWRAIKKIVTSKWFQIAIAVAIIVIAHYYPGSIFGLGGGASAAHAGSAPVLHAALTGAAREAAKLAAEQALAAGGMAALEGAAVSSGIATAVSLGLASVQVAGVAANLSAKAQQKYDKAKDKVHRKIETSSKCRVFLFMRGNVPNLNFEKLEEALSLQRLYDALHSTITLAQAGLLPGSVETVQHYAANHPGLGAMTATYGGSTVASRSGVFFTGLGLRGSTILHEALHSFTGLGDAALAAKLGVTVTSTNTQPISDVLKAHGCT